LKLLDYAWGLVTSIGGRDHENLRVLLDSDLNYPKLTADGKGMVLKFPVPKVVERGFYSLHGQYFDQDERSSAGLWRLFRASLYHGAFHTAYSDFKMYGPWAKGKDLTTATYVVSMLEDFRVTKLGAGQWPGSLPDLAYANYNSAMRAHDVHDLPDAERVATKVLLSLWGVNPKIKGADEDEEAEVRDLAAAVRSSVDKGATGKEGFTKPYLAAGQAIYSAVVKRGKLHEIPTLPYAEAHGVNTIFDSQVVEAESAKSLEEAALSTLGLPLNSISEDKETSDEAKEFLQLMKESEARLQKVKDSYEEFISNTRLESVEFPKGDFANYLRVKSSLSGPIRNIRDQLRSVKNVLDETAGHESGQVDTQAAMQVVASGVARSDVFIREEPITKNEAWAILIDASKSTTSFAHEVKGVGTCLAEVAKELIPAENQWGMFSFNNSLQVIKEFDEDYGNESKARLGGVQERNVTLLPDAIMACNRALSAKPIDTRILVVASDGYPTGYNGIEKNLVSTIKQVTNSGTLLMGVGIDSHAIEEYFTVNCVVSSPYQMMKSFVRAYLELSSLF
jgi:hypothetical protein